MGVAVDDARHLDRVLHRLQADPDAGKARQRTAVEAEIEDLLHARRADDRHVGIDHRPVGLVQHGGAFAGVVVAHRHQDAAMGRGAGHVGVPHHVAGAVDAGALAVPQAEDAVVLALAPQFRLLAAPERGGGEILVQARLERDLRRLEHFRRRAAICRSTAPSGRAAIAGHVAGGVQPRRLVPRALHQHQPHQRLRAVQQHRGSSSGRTGRSATHPASLITHLPCGSRSGISHRSNLLTYKVANSLTHVLA